MEFGPRALGGRSVIAQPNVFRNSKKLNLKIKFRESFRPFAPAILEEKVNEWFDLDVSSPYMLLVSEVHKDKIIPMKKKDKLLFGIDKLNVKRSEIPAVTHVDYSARVQTVSEKTNKRFHKLIKSFYQKTNCPILVNTSFNVRGEPIVCSPTDAFNCFMGTNLDILVLENFILFKSKQKVKPNLDFVSDFELD